MPAILGCTDRNLTSRIKQVVAQVGHPQGHSEEGSQIYQTAVS